MLDENLPTYTLQPSSENPLKTLLYFTHNGSEPTAEYVLQRPAAGDSRRQYAVGLADVHHPTTVVYGEVVVRPEWTQPSLSATELRAAAAAATAAAAGTGTGTGGAQNSGSSTTATATTHPMPVTPDAFTVLLYNPDQSIVVRRNLVGWSKSETWDFEVPERSFREPSASEIDRGASTVSELTPKIVFRWKRDGRLSRDSMTCYMCGRSVGGKKSKEPDITVALFRASGKGDAVVTMYEPNMARVDVDDRKGLEVVLILSAQAVRDLYLAPRQDVFNLAGSGGGGGASAPVPPAAGAATGAPAQAVGAGSAAEETRRAQERRRRDEQEQQRIRIMLDNEERERQAAIDRETERLRREYGLQQQQQQQQQQTHPPSSLPALPPRPGNNYNYNNNNQHVYASGALGGGGEGGGGGGGGPRPPAGAPPARPSSVGPSTLGGKKKHHGPLGGLPNLSGFFHRSDDDRRDKMQKKRSL